MVKRQKYILGTPTWINRNNKMIPVTPLGKYTSGEDTNEAETIAYFKQETDAQKVCDLLNETSRSQGGPF